LAHEHVARGNKGNQTFFGWKHITVVKDCCQKYHFLKIACIWTSTKLILKEFFENNNWNKVVQNPKNKIVKKNPILKLILNDWKVY
jgi:hypothetical protein